MNFAPFSCPIFLGHPRARGRCSQGERVLYGRDLSRSGGTGKAEAAKCVLCIPDTGLRAQEFGPSSAQEDARQKKTTYGTQWHRQEERSNVKSESKFAKGARPQRIRGGHSLRGETAWSSALRSDHSWLGAETVKGTVEQRIPADVSIRS